MLRLAQKAVIHAFRSEKRVTHTLQNEPLTSTFKKPEPFISTTVRLMKKNIAHYPIRTIPYLHPFNYFSSSTLKTNPWFGLSKYKQNYAEIGGGMMMATMFATVIYVLTSKNPNQEQEILDLPIDINKEKPISIVDAEDFIHTGKHPEHGHLSREIVIDKKTGKKYLKKGASDEDSLIQEFLISTWLAYYRPGAQPESLIMQEIQKDGTARYYTLSRIFDNSMDLATFINQKDWKEKIETKPIIGFDLALASDFIFAKQTDMKLDNYIIIEKDNAFVIATIDHEWAGQKGFLHKLLGKNKTIFTTDLDYMISRIADLYQPSDENHSILAGDPRVKEFMAIAKLSMSEENIKHYYEKIKLSETRIILQCIEDMHRYGSNRLIQNIISHKYIDEIKNVQHGAIQYINQEQLKQLKKQTPDHHPEDHLSFTM